MGLKWTSAALSDLVRLHEFLAPLNERAAGRTAQSLAAAPFKLLAHPRVGEKLEEFAPREVRRIVVSNYEIRYEIQGSIIYVLRIWHSKEDR